MTSSLQFVKFFRRHCSANGLGFQKKNYESLNDTLESNMILCDSFLLNNILIQFWLPILFFKQFNTNLSYYSYEGEFN